MNNASKSYSNRAETVSNEMEEEMDESLLDESEKELVANAEATANASDSINRNKPKESCQSEGSGLLGNQLHEKRCCRKQ